MHASVLHTSYPMLFAVVLARQLSLPVPAILFLLAAGVLTGSNKLSLLVVIGIGVVGCLLGDFAWYEAGRLRGNRVLRLICSLAPNPRLYAQKAKATFARYGVRVIVVAKFVPGLDAVTPPLAGMSGVSRLHFLAYDSVGAGLWSTLYVGLGYLFRRQFNLVALYTSRAGATLAFLLIGVFALYAGRQSFVLIRMMLRLRLARITPERLKQRIEAGDDVLIVDLQTFADEGPEIAAGIPGAVLIDPFRLRGREKVRLRGGVDVVLYCSSPNEFTSARVAVALQRKGIFRIAVLDGGLQAWKERGFPLSQEFLSPEKAREIFGIRLAPAGS
jgi:membrane protein DedA with SNARE-associated domain/rhodanese-related sulfurtransferase